MNREEPLADLVQPFQVEGPGVRGRLVRLGPALQQVLAPHAYPPLVAGVLSESLALAVVLASGLEYSGVFSLQLQGDGPLGFLIVDISSDGDLRGYAKFTPDRLTPAAVAQVEGATEPSLLRLVGTGYMAFTVDQGPEIDRYQGIIAIEGANLSDCAHAYFRQSEQIETAIRLCAESPGATASVDAARAAALMIQRLAPRRGDNGDADDDWRRTVVLMSSVTQTELLSPTLSPAEVLYRLFHEDGVRLFRQRSLRHRCRCSRAKVERTLMAFPREEVRAMAEAGNVTVTCEFCKTVYVIDVDHLYGPLS